MGKIAILVHEFLENSAERYPDKVAVVQGRSRADYALINGWANRLADNLIKEGICPGDRVAMLCENSIEYVISYYGILKTGGIAVSLNTDIKPDGLAVLLNELKPKVLLISRKIEKSLHSQNCSLFHVPRIMVIDPWRSTQEINHDASPLYKELEAYSTENPNLRIDSKSCAAIIYTSGSMGKPKGVMLSHANITANTRSIIEYLGLTSEDIQMVVLPFFYVMGKSLLNTHFAVGGRIVINNEFAYTASLFKQMVEERITGFSGVPSTYAYLLFKSPLAQYREKLPALRYCSQAGGHMAKHIKFEFLKILPPHTRLFIMYGATEASARLTYVPPEKLQEKIDSIGIPIPGVTVKVLSPEAKELKAGEIGEIVAQGQNIMIGYYEDGDATRKVLDTHGYHTGDMGWRDEDGFLYISGRKDEQIKVGGHRLNPQEIEDVVIESGFAEECIVFSNSDSLLGNQLTGLVVPIQNKTDALSEIMAYCRNRLPKYKIPAALLPVKAIPKTSSGKLDRSKSAEIFKEISAKGTSDHA